MTSHTRLCSGPNAVASLCLAGAALFPSPVLAQAASAAPRPEVPSAVLESALGGHVGWLVAALGLVILLLVARLLALGSREREFEEFVRRAQHRETLHERRYAELLDNSSDIVYTHDLAGNLITWSKAGEQIAGYTQRDLYQRNLADLAVPEQKEAVGRWLRQVAAGEGPATFELVILARDGSRVTLDASTRAITQEGRPAGVLGFARDMTARKRAEEALRESELRLRTVVNNVPVILFSVDREGVFTLCEGKALAALGLKPGALVGRSVDDLERFLPGIGQTFSRALSGESFTATHAAGGLIYEGQVGPVRDSHGGITGLIGIAIEVTERKKSEEAAEKARKAAEAASRAKSEFLANISHEIRTPINGILGMTALALDTELTGEQREYLETIRMSADALMSVVAGILDFSKVDAGKIELEHAQFGLRDLLDAALKPLITRGRQKGLQVACRVDADTPDAVVGDSSRLSQVITSLVDNGVKFTSKGSVAVGVSAEFVDDDEALLRFEVADTGIGIPAEAQEVVFEPFTQADGSTTRRYGGTGLGLTIARRLVEMMGGEIGVESAAGEGSKFYFTLPLSIANERGNGASREQRDEGKKVLRAAPSGNRAGELRILVAEPVPASQKLIRFFLEKQGHTVTIESDGAGALAALRDAGPGRFDLALIDLELPRVSVFEVVGALRQREKDTSRRLPVIALGARTVKSGRDQGLRAGMDDYLLKPVRRRELLEMIARHAPETPRRLVETPLAAFDPAECIRRAGGNRTLVKEMAEIFLKTSPKALAEMRGAIESGEREKLRRNLNTLRSSLGALSEGAAYEAARTLEHEIRQADANKLSKALETLEAQIEQLRPALAAFLDDRTAGTGKPLSPQPAADGVRVM